jgi:hypothetical protein
MTPPVANSAGALRRPLAPHAPRRISGPARPVRGRDQSPPQASTPSQIRRRRWLIAVPSALGRAAVALPESRALDRLVRGRAWIAIVATALVGIVYLQVSLLSMNESITRSVHAAQALEASNTVLQGQIAQDAAGGRIQDVAGREGMVMPPAMWSAYVTATPHDATRAATSITAPDPAAEQRNAAANAALAPPDALPTLNPQASGAQPAAIAPTADTAAAAVTAAAAQASSGTVPDGSATATPAAAVVAPAATAAPTTTAAPAAAATPPAAVSTSTPAPTPTSVSAVAATTGTGGVSAGP